MIVLLKSTDAEYTVPTDQLITQVSCDNQTAMWKGLGAEPTLNSRIAGASYDSDTVGLQQFAFTTLVPVRFTKVKCFSGMIWLVVKSSIGAD